MGPPPALPPYPSSPPPSPSPPPPSPSSPSVQVVTCGGTEKKCDSKRFSFTSAHGVIRLDCIGKDGCNSVDLDCCEDPSLCSVVCADGDPACNSLTVSTGISVTCNPKSACNSVSHENCRGDDDD